MVPETIRFLCLNKLAVHFLALVLTQNHGLLRIWKWKFMSYPSYSTGPKLFCTYSNFFGLVFKVQLFWEGHNLQSALWFWRFLSKFQNHKEHCVHFCGLLRKYELDEKAWLKNLAKKIWSENNLTIIKYQMKTILYTALHSAALLF